ncbi:hypothetical protein DSO57_1025038 [Entomophthora muscae]|uniref:Uncharacterized protein n=1 Tax=Entomophthora muscae TaxID=34485 RepID=A0ACC2RHA6_9FUNG|nr:hypothetical protein DSO57_1025038 [Entomophthora muscae]
MSTATAELPLVTINPSYEYSTLAFAYITMLRLTEQVISHMKARHFPSTEEFPEIILSHDTERHKDRKAKGSAGQEK